MFNEMSEGQWRIWAASCLIDGVGAADASPMQDAVMVKTLQVWIEADHSRQWQSCTTQCRVLLLSLL